MVRDLQGAHILTADLARSRTELLESPWLADVALRRVLPSTIDVFVSERRPFGLCRQGDQLYLVARDGTSMDEFGPRYADFDLPIVDGLFPRQSRSRVSPRVAGAVRHRHRRPIRARAALAASVVDALRRAAGAHQDRLADRRQRRARRRRAARQRSGAAAPRRGALSRAPAVVPGDCRRAQSAHRRTSTTWIFASSNAST